MTVYLRKEIVMNARILVVGLTVAAMAGSPLSAQSGQVDVPTLTCSVFTAMTAAEKIQAMNATRVWVKESANAEEAGTAQLAGDLDDEALMGRMDAACVNAETDLTVIAALRQGA